MVGINLGDDLSIRINLEDKALLLLRQMAQEAGLGAADLAKIAVYNLIALWQRDKGIGIQPMDSHDGVDSVDKFHLP